MSSAAPAPLARRQFASDNYSGMCPEAWEALQQANCGHAPAYGNDAWTARASDLLRELFEVDCEVFFVFNGTAANSLALASLCHSYHSIICHELCGTSRPTSAALRSSFRTEPSCCWSPVRRGVSSLRRLSAR